MRIKINKVSPALFYGQYVLFLALLYEIFPLSHLKMLSQCFCQCLETSLQAPHRPLLRFSQSGAQGRQFIARSKSLGSLFFRTVSEAVNSISHRYKYEYNVTLRTNNFITTSLQIVECITLTYIQITSNPHAYHLRQKI